jgi:hypothetical protein
MAEIFISYKSDRRNAAKHLAGVLTRYGYSVWFDYGLIKGDDFDFQLDRQLRDAKAVIVLWCSMSVESAWVSREASLAAKLKTLLPVLIEDCELKLAYHTADYVDLIKWDGSPRSYMLDPLLRGVTRLVGREPQANWADLSKYEEDWRMFGSPSLAAFALGKPVEPAQGPEWGLAALAGREWPSVRDSRDISKLRRFEKHFAGTWYADEARELRRAAENATRGEKEISTNGTGRLYERVFEPAVHKFFELSGRFRYLRTALTGVQATKISGNSFLRIIDSTRRWWIATFSLVVVLCASSAPNLAMFLDDPSKLSTSALAAAVGMTAVFLFASQLTESVVARVAITLGFVTGSFVAVPASFLVKLMTAPFFSYAGYLSNYAALELAIPCGFAGAAAVLLSTGHLAAVHALRFVALFLALVVVRYFIFISTDSLGKVVPWLIPGWPVAVRIPLYCGGLFFRRLRPISLRKYLIVCLIGELLALALFFPILGSLVESLGRFFGTGEFGIMFYVYILPLLTVWVGLRFALRRTGP